MNIIIVGVGYIGLVTGLCFAKLGHNVHFFDTDKDKINKLKNGKLIFYEPKVKELLEETKSRIHFSDELNDLSENDIIFICTGTPTIDNKIDLSYVKKSAEKIGGLLKSKSEYKIIVIKSTVLPGTTKNIVLPILEKFSDKKAGKDFGLCMNPEFLREGSAVEDFLYPDRIVIGSSDDKGGKIMSDFYAAIFENVDILNTNLTTAEIVKYASNSFFPLLISFSNEIANICETVEEKADVEDVLNALWLDKRISPIIDGKRVDPGIIRYIKAGCGFGGSCFPKDLRAFLQFSKGLNYEPKLLESILHINDTQIIRLIKRAEAAIGDLSSKVIAVLGLSFKPDTDDIRDSPSIKLISELLKKNAKIKAHDPVAIENTKKILGNEENLEFYNDAFDALKEADVCFVVTSWKDYFNITQDDFKKFMKGAVVIDCRRIYNPNKMQEIRYIGTGIKDEFGK
tara:strand:- start:21704 stop:23068 length:1365 start_codon:yes stop_codon:yes gene_type:complete